MRKWRVWCEDDTKFVEAWSMAKPTTCPENGAHVITAAKTCVVDDECHCQALEVNEQTGTSYTATYTDTFKYVLCTNAAAFALTIDPESAEPFSVGAWFYAVKGGAGDVTLTEGSGVTISGLKVITSPFARVKVVKKAANVWHASGEAAMTLAELNVLVTDATLDDSGDERDPTAHAAEHTDGTDDVQDATSGQKGLATAAQITKLDAIEALADVTDAANVDSAGALMNADFDAGTFQYATLDDTPEPKTPAEVRDILKTTAYASFFIDAKDFTPRATNGPAANTEEVSDGGTHDGLDDAAVLTDSTASWTIDALIGKVIENVTDGSSGIITDNTATTVTATLAGGDNDWDIGDTYLISHLMVEQFLFDPDVEEAMQKKHYMPDDWDLGTIKAKVVWDGSTGATPGDVVMWGLRAVAIGNGENMDIAGGAEVTVTDILLALRQVHTTDATGAITVGGTPGLGKPVWFQIARKAEEGADTMDGEDAKCLGIAVQYGILAAGPTQW